MIGERKLFKSSMYPFVDSVFSSQVQQLAAQATDDPGHVYRW